jgi:hypothetical protein
MIHQHYMPTWRWRLVNNWQWACLTHIMCVCICLRHCRSSLPPAINFYRSCVGLGWLAQETTRFILVRASEEYYPMSSDLLPCSWARCARSRGYKLVVRQSSFPGPGRWCSILWRSNPCDRCPPLPFIVTMGGAQGEVKKSYSAWQLARPVVRRCPSGCIEAKSRCLVGEAAAWPSWTVYSGTLGLLPE